MATDYDEMKAKYPELMACEQRCLELEAEVERLRERLEAAERNYATVYENAERAEQLMTHTWEKQGTELERARVIGGWLYRTWRLVTRQKPGGYGVEDVRANQQMVFVPDPALKGEGE